MLVREGWISGSPESLTRPVLAIRSRPAGATRRVHQFAETVTTGRQWERRRHRHEIENDDIASSGRAAPASSVSAADSHKSLRSYPDFQKIPSKRYRSLWRVARRIKRSRLNR
jgi:hypothetical protein